MKRIAVFAAWLTAATYAWTLVRVADRPHPPIDSRQESKQ